MRVNPPLERRDPRLPLRVGPLPEEAPHLGAARGAVDVVASERPDRREAAHAEAAQIVTTAPVLHSADADHRNRIGAVRDGRALAVEVGDVGVDRHDAAPNATPRAALIAFCFARYARRCARL